MKKFEIRYVEGRSEKVEAAKLLESGSGNAVLLTDNNGEILAVFPLAQIAGIYPA